jgi:hypothetical protein
MNDNHGDECEAKGTLADSNKDFGEEENREEKISFFFKYFSIFFKSKENDLNL